MNKALFVLAASLMGLAAQADTLDFSGDICSSATDGSGAMVACANGGRINQSYGDTALVDVTFKSQVSGSNSMYFWGSAYSGLSAVAYGDSGATPEITLTAIGSTITLQSLDLGAWPNTDRPSQLTVVDLATNAAVFSSGAITVLGATASSFSFNLSSNTGFAIQFGPDGYNVGIDNIQFTTTPVPEASTYAMLLAGLAAVGSVVRRRTRR
jgi:PEP-CTERM motif